MAISKCIIVGGLLVMQFVGCINTAFSQDGMYPVIGKPIPAFKLANVKYHTKPSIDNKDLAGKWTILDFWTKYCTSCVASFPKVDALQREFKTEVQFFLVGLNDNRNKNTDAIYERYRKAKGLELATAYDSVIFQQFGIHGVPHIVVVDPTGVVYAVTDASFLATENLKELIAGNNPSFKKLYNKFESSEPIIFWEHFVFDKQVRKPEVLARSILDRYSQGIAAGMLAIDQVAIDRAMYQVTKASLSDLYKVACFGASIWDKSSSMYGAYWPHPVLEVMDSSLFYTNYSTSVGFYNYQLIVPKLKSSVAYLMDRVQGDLNIYFGYDVTVETRTMPYWSLTATGKALKSLITKSDKTEYYGDPSGIVAKRIPVKSLIGLIDQYAFAASGIPLLDETAITDKIDIEFHAALTDPHDVAKELRKLGLILEKREKPMKVLVIRDPNPESVSAP